MDYSPDMPNYKYLDEGRTHMHTRHGNPIVGGSTMKSIIGNKDALFQWYADMAAVAGLGFPYQDIKAEYDAVQAIKDWKEKAKAKKALDKKYPNFEKSRKAAVAHRDQKADEGTLRHGELQGYINRCIAELGGKPSLFIPEGASESLRRFADWSHENVEQFHFTEAHCYHDDISGIPVGGIADIGLTLKDGRRLVGDHKSSKYAYEDQFLQCAIYDVLLGYSGGLDRDGNKLFDWQLADGYVVFPFRSEPFTPEFRWNADQFRKGVESTADLYKLLELNK